MKELNLVWSCWNRSLWRQCGSGSIANEQAVVDEEYAYLGEREWCMIDWRLMFGGFWRWWQSEREGDCMCCIIVWTTKWRDIGLFWSELAIEKLSMCVCGYNFFIFFRCVDTMKAQRAHVFRDHPPKMFSHWRKLNLRPSALQLSQHSSTNMCFV